MTTTLKNCGNPGHNDPDNKTHQIVTKTALSLARARVYTSPTAYIIMKRPASASIKYHHINTRRKETARSRKLAGRRYYMTPQS